MPIDPGIITAGMRQPEQVDPMGVLGKVLTLRNAQQEQQTGAIKLQQAQQGQADLHALDQAYASGGGNRDSIINALPGHMRPAVQKQFAEADESALKVQKLKDETAAAERDYFGSLAAGVKAHGYDPGAAMIALQHAKQAGYGQQADQLWEQIKQDPTHLQPLVDQMIAQSPKQAELVTQAQTAGARVQSAQTAADVAKANAPLIAANTLNAQQRATGTEPLSLYQQAQLKREANANAETARHNKVTEANANPFGAAGVTPAGAAASGPGVSGDEYLKTLPAGIASEVKAYAEGRRPFPTGMAMKAPYFQQMIQAVSQYDPSFDAVNFNGRNAARKDFAAGASAKQITALNTVIGHLGDLDQKAGALGNGSVQMLNSLKNFVKTETGSSDVTNFNTVKKGVTDELTRVWRQAGGSEQDIKTWGESLNAAQSPQQLKGAFSTIAGMLGARLDALENQKQQGLGKFGNDINIVTPKAKQVLQRLGGESSMQQPIPGIAGGIAESTDGGKTWKRIK